MPTVTFWSPSGAIKKQEVPAESLSAVLRDAFLHGEGSFMIRLGEGGKKEKARSDSDLSLPVEKEVKGESKDDA